MDQKRYKARSIRFQSFEDARTIRAINHKMQRSSKRNNVLDQIRNLDAQKNDESLMDEKNWQQPQVKAASKSKKDLAKERYDQLLLWKEEKKKRTEVMNRQKVPPFHSGKYQPDAAKFLVSDDDVSQTMMLKTPKIMKTPFAKMKNKSIDPDHATVKMSVNTPGTRFTRFRCGVTPALSAMKKPFPAVGRNLWQRKGRNLRSSMKKLLPEEVGNSLSSSFAPDNFVFQAPFGMVQIHDLKQKENEDMNKLDQKHQLNVSFTIEEAEEMISEMDVCENEANEDEIKVVDIHKNEEKVITENEADVFNESEENVINENEADVFNENEENVINENEADVFNENEENVINENEADVFNESEENVINENEADVFNENEENVINENEADVFNESEENVINESEENVINENEADVFNENEENVINENEADVFNENEENVNNENEAVVFNKNEENVVISECEADVNEIEVVIATETDKESDAVSFFHHPKTPKRGRSFCCHSNNPYNLRSRTPCSRSTRRSLAAHCDINDYSNVFPSTPTMKTPRKSSHYKSVVIVDEVVSLETNDINESNISSGAIAEHGTNESIGNQDDKSSTDEEKVLLSFCPSPVDPLPLEEYPPATPNFLFTPDFSQNGLQLCRNKLSLLQKECSPWVTTNRGSSSKKRRLLGFPALKSDLDGLFDDLTPKNDQENSHKGKTSVNVQEGPPPQQTPQRDHPFKRKSLRLSNRRSVRMSLLPGMSPQIQPQDDDPLIDGDLIDWNSPLLLKNDCN